MADVLAAGTSSSFRCPVCFHSGTAWTRVVDGDPHVDALVKAELLLHRAYTGHNDALGEERPTFGFARSPYATEHRLDPPT